MRFLCQFVVLLHNGALYPGPSHPLKEASSRQQRTVLLIMRILLLLFMMKIFLLARV